MGMSTRVVGFRKPDKKWNDMKAVWDACDSANVHMPDAVKKQKEIYPKGQLWKVWVCWILNFVVWPLAVVIAAINEGRK